MCIILFAYKSHPKYSMIVAANRDEAYARPTVAAHFWEDYPQVLGGRDQLQNGTWMGVTRNGRFAALTNYRDPRSLQSGAKSRGDLVKQFLIRQEEPFDYLQSVCKHRQEYGGFNLLVGDFEQLFYYSAQLNLTQQLKPGIYGLSNAHLNTPWPKIEKGKSMLADIVKDQEEIHPQSIFSLLGNVEQPIDKLLPATGVGLELERRLSPIFIVSPHYGTRSSTVLTVGFDRKVEFTERSFVNGAPVGDTHFSFYWPSGAKNIDS